MKHLIKIIVTSHRSEAELRTTYVSKIYTGLQKKSCLRAIFSKLFLARRIISDHGFDSFINKFPLIAFYAKKVKKKMAETLLKNHRLKIFRRIKL